jgi:hypothetical protein
MDKKKNTGKEVRQLVRYDTGAFIKTYENDGAVYYASFHPELYSEEDSLEATARYLVVLLQPTGLTQLYLVSRDGKWIPDDDDFDEDNADWISDMQPENTDEDADNRTRSYDQLISPDMLQWLSDAIINHEA